MHKAQDDLCRNFKISQDSMILPLIVWGVCGNHLLVVAMSRDTVNGLSVNVLKLRLRVRDEQVGDCCR